jgi:RNA recognition motif-containing protein
VKTLFVANIPWAATELQLMDFFAQAGKVRRAKIMTDRDTGKSRGFGFVEMETDTGGAAAISRFNGAKDLGRPLVVNEAKPRPGHR